MMIVLEEKINEINGNNICKLYIISVNIILIFIVLILHEYTHYLAFNCYGIKTKVGLFYFKVIDKRKYTYLKFFGEITPEMLFLFYALPFLIIDIPLFFMLTIKKNKMYLPALYVIIECVCYIFPVYPFDSKEVYNSLNLMKIEYNIFRIISSFMIVFLLFSYFLHKRLLKEVEKNE